MGRIAILSENEINWVQQYRTQRSIFLPWMHVGIMPLLLYLLYFDFSEMLETGDFSLQKSTIPLAMALMAFMYDLKFRSDYKSAGAIGDAGIIIFNKKKRHSYYLIPWSRIQATWNPQLFQLLHGTEHDKHFPFKNRRKKQFALPVAFSLYDAQSNKKLVDYIKERVNIASDS